MGNHKFKRMSDEFLRRNFIPDVYQHDIYSIDYQKLKDAGIKLISFDIDDTIAGWEDRSPSDSAKILFANLKKMGFTVELLTNATEERGRHFRKALEADGYIARAKKPLSKNFKLLQDRHGLEPSQMAHVGNSQMDDIGGGNAFGVTTCLVRRVGKVTKLVGIPEKIGLLTEGQQLRKELEARDMWRKHHKNVKDDQYYQLNETPAYRN